MHTKICLKPYKKTICDTEAYRHTQTEADYTDESSGFQNNRVSFFKDNYRLLRADLTQRSKSGYSLQIITAANEQDRGSLFVKEIQSCVVFKTQKFTLLA
jgi:hypothetical protein